MTALTRLDPARTRLRLVRPPDAALARPSRRERRIAGRARAAAQVRQPLAPAEREHDPLAHRRRSRRGTAAAVVLLGSLGIAAHVALVLAAVGVSRLSGDDRRHRLVRERIELRSVEPAPRQQTAPEPPRASRPTPSRPHPEPVPAPRSAPPPDPTPAPAPAPSAPAPRRIVGLSLESTVGAGGGGPAFAVGNTRMGETAARAEDPSSVGAPPAEGNRVAVRRPGARFAPPSKLQAVTPEYPAALEAQGIEGDVVVRVELDASGAVTAAAVQKSSGYAELDASAVRASSAERWSPATRDGVPVPDVLTFTVRFRLTKG